jgi:hypothetical protein
MFSQTPIYYSNNGALIKSFFLDNQRIVIRSHTQKIIFGNHSSRMNRFLYSDYNNKPENIIDEFKINDEITIYEVIEITNHNDKSCLIWLGIYSPTNKKGYIFLNSDDDPYKNSNGLILNVVNSSTDTIIIRKYEQPFYPTNEVDVIDKPWVSSPSILFKIHPNIDGNYSQVTSQAITANYFVVGKNQDHWIKIIDQEKREGWIFGSNLMNYNRYFKYLTPEYIIYSYLGEF